MLARFYVPALGQGSTSTVLDEDQSHHLVSVLRLAAGAPVRVFDGRGREWQGVVERGDRKAATVGDLREVTPLPEPAVRVTVLAAVLRGSAMDALVHDATMLGAARIVPALSTRVSVARRVDALEAARARWMRIAIATCRQCGRARVPEIAAPLALADALGITGAAVRLTLAEPTLEAEATHRIDGLAERARAGGATLAIGPEGGWTQEEIQLAADHGFSPWSLGPLVLRAESVPLAALAVLRYAWG